MEFSHTLVIPDNATPDRADKLLVEVLGAEKSRSAVAALLRKGLVLVNGRSVRPSTVLHPGARVEILPEESAKQPRPVSPPPDFSILYEDDDLVVVNKPAGLTVHPGAGRESQTLMDLLVRTRPGMVGVGEPGRWGVVHRLDKDTSGVMVVAKTAEAHAALSLRFKEHSIHRVYLALVRGNPGSDQGVAVASIGRHPKDRKRMSVSSSRPRHAVTGWRVLERFDDAALLEVKPQTGRTHQIRVHLASMGLPVLGDLVYGKPRKTAKPAGVLLRRAREIMKRQALHAAELGFPHPVTGEYLEFSAPLPDDMKSVLDLFRPRPESSVL